LEGLKATMMTHGSGNLPTTNDAAKFLGIAHQTFPNPPLGWAAVMGET